MKEPESPAEWQEALDAAMASRLLADCKMYGLIEGGPNVNVSRCDEIIERAQALGLRPSKRDVELAIEMVREINAGAAK